MSASTPLLDAAIAYTAAGYAPVPVRPGSKAPVMREWPKFAPGPEGLGSHFRGKRNIGLILGERSGWLVDIDLDCDEALELADQFLPPTPTKTGRPSRPNSHWWYICKGATSIKFRLVGINKPIVEFRSTGCQTVVGPSVHPSGERYDVLAGQPAEVAPEVLLAQVRRLAEAIALRRGVPLKEGPARPQPISTGRSSKSGANVNRRASAYLARIPGAIEGQDGSGQCYAAATAMVHGFALGEEAGYQLLAQEYNHRCEPPWSEKELRHKCEDAATKEHDMPLGWLRDAPPPGKPPLGQDSSPADGGDDPRTDLGNAERFARMYRDQVRFCGAIGQWFTWSGTHWKECPAEHPLYLAGAVARQLGTEAQAEPDPDRRKIALAWAKRTESRRGLEAIVALAKALPDCRMELDQLDSDPLLFNVLNGTVDLRTGALLPHRREDFITKVAPVEYDPQAKCPLFDGCLLRTFGGDVELIRFVLRLLGYGLTGLIRDQVFPILHGDGANGKSLLLDTVMGIMGDYAGHAPPNLLVESKFAEHPTEIAALQGKRLVVAAEMEENATLRVQLVKRMTGESKLIARRMRQDFYEFDRTHKTLLVTNNVPRIPETSHAIWRRVLLVPFLVTIPEHEQDTRLLEKLRSEWPGILAKLVRGCLAWQASGLVPPDAVLLATAEYRRDEDQFGRFLAERCRVDQEREASTLFTPWQVLVACYRDWCVTEGQQGLSEAALRAECRRRGYPTMTRRHGGSPAKGRLGIALLGQEEQPQ